MAKTRVVLNRFNSGEFSGKMDALVDYQRYYNACRIMENAIPIPQGGAMRRPGTYYVGAMADSTKKGKLAPFHFSTVQAYVLEFGNYTLRFYKDGGQIVMAYAAWQTTTAYALGDLVTNGGSYYRCRIAHTSGTFATDLGNLKWEETAGAADLAYEIPTDYAEADLYDLKFTPSNDVLYILHPSYPPAKLTRTGHTAWTLANVNFVYDEPETISGATKANPCVVTVTGHGFEAGDEVIIEDVAGMTQLNRCLFRISAPATNTVALKGINSGGYSDYTSGGTMKRNPYIGQAKAITGISKANPAVVTCAGHGYPDGTVVLIRDVLGMTTVNDTIFTTANGTDDTFELSGIDSSAYPAYTSGGIVRAKPFTATNEYPSCGAFFEQRLLLALNQTVWGSRTGDYENFQTGTLDDHAFSYIIASDKVDTIQWMIAQDYCMLGTAGGIWRLSGAGDDPITPSSVNCRKQTGFGVTGIEPEMVDDTILFIQRGGRRVQELGYSLEKDGYIANDMSVLADHIAKAATQATSGISDVDYQAEPFSIFWGVRRDGQLLGFIRNRAQQVAGWCRIVTGRASSVATDTVESVVSTETESGESVVLTLTRTLANPAVDSWDEIESIAVITNESEEDEVWISVKRLINGSYVRYIEYFKPHEFFSSLPDYFGVDSGLTFDGGDAVAISGITKANPAVVTTTAHHGFTNGQKVRIIGVEGMTEANQGLTEAYTVANKTDHTFELSGIDSSAWTAYTSGGTARVVTNTITGLGHLEGKTVDILMDGARHPASVVASGAVSLSWYGNLIHAGLPYAPIVQPMKAEVNTDSGSSIGKKKRIFKLGVRFFESFGCLWGPDKDNLDIVPFGDGQTPELFTGDMEYPFDGPIDTAGDIYITQSGPFPMTILAIIADMEVF